MRRALALLALSPALAAQTTWYVDVNGTPPGSGTQNDPYTSIQFAIFAPSTVSGDRLLVAPGDYPESIDYSGKSLSIVSTDGAALTRIVPPLFERGVLVASGEGPGTELHGFTVTESFASGDFGNGVRVVGATFALKECSIVDNGDFSAPGVGGVYAEDSVLLVENCTVASNGAVDVFGGGGLHLSDCTSRVRGSVIAGNVGDPAGGLFVDGGTALVEDTLLAENTTANANAAGMHVAAGVVVIRDSRFERNVTHFDDYRGGGLYVSGGDVTVQDTAFVENFSGAGGGASVEGGSARFLRCTFLGNVAESTFNIQPGSGGGIDAKVPVTAERCVFAFNAANGGCVCGDAGQGGAFRGLVSAQHCTLFGNSAAVAGGGAYGGTLHDGIAWGNAPDQLAGGAVATWSDVEGGWPGTGNFSADPLFYSELLPDVHLRPGSPCIDAGDPMTPPDGDGSVTDVGAFPFDPSFVPEPVRYCSAKVSSQGCAAAIGSQGQPTLGGADDFFITAGDVLGGQFGLMIWGTAAAEQPFFGGTLCVGAFQRTPVVASGGNGGGVDCSGSLAFHFSHAYMAAQGLVGFETLYAQWWYRDPGFAAPDNVGLTDALAFVIVP